MKTFHKEDVVKIYKALEEKGVEVWIDGGWAVGALLEEETRPHEDLDLAVEEKDLERIKNFLIERGYKEIDRAEDIKWDSVWADMEGREIELHSFKRKGNGEIEKEEYWDGYEEGSLSGKGSIDGYEVRCVSVEQLFKTKKREKDIEDLSRLRNKFKM